MKDELKTDYSDEKLFVTAQALYEGEISLSQHYENLRSAVTGVNLALVSGLLASSQLSTGPESAPTSPASTALLVLLALVASTLTLRLSHAHYFHFELASKMRGCISRHHPKVESKLNEVRTEWDGSVKRWRWLAHSFIWVGLNAAVPITVAVLS